MKLWKDNGIHVLTSWLMAAFDTAGKPWRREQLGRSGGLFLAAAGCPTTIIIRGQDLTASMSRYLIDRIEADARATVRATTRIASLESERTLTSLRVAIDK